MTRVLNHTKYRAVFPHEFAYDQFERLEAAILGVGRILVPIIADEHGNILDGFSRWCVYLANRGKVASPPVTVLTGLSEDEKRRLILELNFHRRHLTQGQRKDTAGALRVSSPGSGTPAAPGGGQPACPRPAQATKRPGVVLNKNLKDTQKTIEELKKGAAISDVGTTRTLLRNRMQGEYSRHVRVRGDVPTDGITLLAGDSRRALADLEPGSVGLILTDPLYHEERVEDWRWLGSWAVRVLRPGGFLAAYSGTASLHSHLAALLEGGLTWRAMGSVVRPNADTPRGAVVLNRHRPVFIASNGPGVAPRHFTDVYTSRPRTSHDDLRAMEKDCHEYQQRLGGFLHWLVHLSRPGDLVADPFGGGFTTAVACALAGRRFIGCDLDEKNVRIGWDRLNDLDGEAARLTAEERKKYGL